MRVIQKVLAVAVLAAAASANAAVVATWDWAVTSEFVGPVTFVGSGGGTTGVPGAGVGFTATPSTLSWGSNSPLTPPQQSSLVISDSPASFLSGVSTPPVPARSALVTCKPPYTSACSLAELSTAPYPQPTQTFTHNNFPIQDPFLASATVKTTLTLIPDTLDGGGPAFPTVIGPVSATFTILFAETDNHPASGLCAGGVPDPEPNLPFGGCPDIFVLQGNFNAFPFTYNSDTHVVGGSGPGDQTYFVQILPNLSGTPLHTLLPGQCLEATGSSDPCVGFITDENKSNKTQFGFAITTQQVTLTTPEPGTLALFALALVGLGFTVRRRQL